MTPLARPGMVIAACTLLAGTGCSRDEAPASQTATWTVEPTPVLTLGADLGDEAVLFERITGATRLPDGRILVADLGTAPLKLFRADGHYEGARAREGGGPGEYRYLARLLVCGDSVYAYDIDGYRTSVLTRDGRYVRAFRFPVPEGQQTPYLSACNADGHFVHIGWGAAPTVAGVHRDLVPAWTTEGAEGSVTLLDTVPGSERWGQTFGGRIVGSRPLPFGKQPHVGAGAQRLYIATGDVFGALVYDVDSGRVRTVSSEAPAAPVTQEDIRARIEREVLEDGEAYRKGIERDFGEIVYPVEHAKVTALVVDASDHLWLRQYAAPDADVATWQVFSPTGLRVATVDVPQTLEVLEIGDDYLLGRAIDAETGGPVIRLHALSRAVR